MKTLLIEIKTSVLATLVTAAVLCGLYPLIVWGGGQLLFSKQANGSLFTGTDGKVYGSSLLGQNFTAPGYFHPRPSAAGTGYDASSSSGTNLGPTSQKLADAIKDAVAKYRAENNLAADATVPADAVTSSGSGLDPHISVKNALLQIPRVAKERQLGEDAVKALVQKSTDGRSLGIFGEPGVNVLKLNLLLDGKLKD